MYILNLRDVVCLEVSRHPVKFGKVVHKVGWLGPDLLGNFSLLYHRQVGELEHQLTVDYRAGRVHQLLTTLSIGTVAFGIKSWGEDEMSKKNCRGES